MVASSLSETKLVCTLPDDHCSHMQGEGDLSFTKMQLPWDVEVSHVMKKLQATTPDRADLVPLWVTGGTTAMVRNGTYATTMNCIFRDYSSYWSTEGTHMTRDMAGERGDDMDSVTVRHVALVDPSHVSWIIVERPTCQLGFETESEYKEWLARHLDYEYKSRATQLDAMPNKKCPAWSGGASGGGNEEKKRAWPVANLNGWFKFLWHRIHNQGQLERTRAHCFDKLGRRYITAYGDGDHARMTKWSGVKPSTEKRERNVGLMWVNCDPTLSLFEDGADSKVVPPPQVGDSLPIASVGRIGEMQVLQTAMNIGEPVGWVLARVTGLPDEYPSDDNDEIDETEDGVTSSSFA